MADEVEEADGVDVVAKPPLTATGLISILAGVLLHLVNASVIRRAIVETCKEQNLPLPAADIFNDVLKSSRIATKEGRKLAKKGTKLAKDGTRKGTFSAYIIYVTKSLDEAKHDTRSPLYQAFHTLTDDGKSGQGKKMTMVSKQWKGLSAQAKAAFTLKYKPLTDQLTLELKEGRKKDFDLIQRIRDFEMNKTAGPSRTGASPAAVKAAPKAVQGKGKAVVAAEASSSGSEVEDEEEEVAPLQVAPPAKVAKAAASAAASPAVKAAPAPAKAPKHKAVVAAAAEKVAAPAAAAVASPAAKSKKRSGDAEGLSKSDKKKAKKEAAAAAAAAGPSSPSV